jgi:hypothetical protein
MQPAMQATITIGSVAFSVDLSRPHDVSIPVSPQFAVDPEADKATDKPEADGTLKLHARAVCVVCWLQRCVRRGAVGRAIMFACVCVCVDPEADKVTDKPEADGTFVCACVCV